MARQCEVTLCPSVLYVPDFVINLSDISATNFTDERLSVS